MRIVKALIFVLSFGALAAPVFAGEDTTYRDHCVGRAYWEMPVPQGGMSPAQADCGSTTDG